MTAFHLQCVECGGVFDEDPALLACPHCSPLQEPGQHTRGVLLVCLDEIPRHWPRHAMELRNWLPLPRDLELPHHPVGNTPLLAVSRLRQHLGMPHLWVKDDTRNPSASTKDRASWLVCAKALEYGLGTVAAASTGNAASALASCAAAMGLRAVLFVPSSAPAAKLLQIRACGATLLTVRGSYDQAFELSTAVCRARGWYNRNTALNPFTIEGKKTAALEIAIDLPGHTADAVFVGTGDGVILGGLGKGFSDLRDAGLLSQLPRLMAVQAGTSCALARGWEAGSSVAARVERATSVADSLNVEAPRNAVHALRMLKESNGDCVCVEDEAVREAVALLGAQTGIFAEPAGAAALAGLLEALASGRVQRSDRVVLLITGHGLKDPAAAQPQLSAPLEISSSLDEFPTDLQAL